MCRATRWLTVSTLVLTFFVTASAHAGPRLALETKGGTALATYTSDAASPTQKAGFAGALALHRALSPRLTIAYELAYVMKGASYGDVTDPTLNGITYTGTFEKRQTADYLELPVLLRATLSDGAVRPVLVVGPSLGIKVVEQARLRSPGAYDKQAAGSDLLPLDLGLAGGLGLELGPRAHCMTLEARYTQGLLDAQKASLSGTRRNSDLRFSLGWKTTWNTGMAAF